MPQMIYDKILRSSRWEKSNNGTIRLLGPFEPGPKVVPISGTQCAVQIYVNKDRNMCFHA